MQLASGIVQDDLNQLKRGLNQDNSIFASSRQMKQKQHEHINFPSTTFFLCGYGLNFCLSI